MNEVVEKIISVDKSINQNFPARSVKVPEQADVVFEWLPTVFVLVEAFASREKDKIRKAVIIFGFVRIVSDIIITVLKKNIDRRRPDSVLQYNSFPSRHSAISFSGAQQLHMQSIGSTEAYGGFAFATFTALLRVHRKRHWLSDVIAGAIIGIVSVRIAHFIYARFSRENG